MDEHLAKVKWSLFLRYGLEPFDNWMTLRRDKLERADVVKALQFETVRKYARNTIKDSRAKIELIEALLVESEAQHADDGEK